MEINGFMTQVVCETGSVFNIVSPTIDLMVLLNMLAQGSLTVEEFLAGVASDATPEQLEGAIQFVSQCFIGS